MARLIATLFLSLILLACGSPKNETLDAAQVLSAADSLTLALDAIQQQDLLKGFAVAIVNDKEVLYAKGFGYADVEAQKAYTEHSLQHIASVSKTLIGIALLKAQEEGKLKLDDPIQDYLPFQVINPLFPKQTIRIRHLATHTSGINDSDQYMDHAWIISKHQDTNEVRTDFPYQRLNPWEKWLPLEEYLSGYLREGGSYYQAENFLPHETGKRYNYSNIGASLAALIVEKATGIAFDQYTKMHILDPLGMESTAWFLDDIDLSRHSKLYRNDYSVLPLYTAITYPDGMLISSASDMGKYLCELVKAYDGRGTLLQAESYQEYFREQLNESHFEEGERDPNHPYDEDYDPAIFIGHSALGYVGHSGGDAGVGTWFFIDKKSKTGRYIVKNTDSGNDNRAKELQYYAIWDKMNEYVEALNKEAKH